MIVTSAKFHPKKHYDQFFFPRKKKLSVRQMNFPTCQGNPLGLFLVPGVRIKKKFYDKQNFTYSVLFVALAE